MVKFRENKVDLNLGLYILLVQIDCNEAVTQQQLADHLQKDKSVVMRQINALMDKDYVVRLWNKKDKRKKDLVLTERGKEMLEFTKTLALKVSNELLSGVEDNDRRVFENVILQILQNGGCEDDCVKIISFKRTI
jgi:DNA-binding MarR family transcriptional regulator